MLGAAYHSGVIWLALSDDVAAMDALHFVKTYLPPPPARLLEVGCGDGRLARALDRLGYRVTAIDPDAPAGKIFLRVSLEDFSDPLGFDAAVASRALHHVADLAGALSKLHRLLMAEGSLLVIEHACERFDEATARWYLQRRRDTDAGAPGSVQRCLAEWKADHAGLHGAVAMCRELDRRFAQGFFSWTPYLYRELGAAFEHEERRLIEAGAIQATGFVYVGKRRSRRTG
jgi:SAM-dependent methyltransferase